MLICLFVRKRLLLSSKRPQFIRKRKLQKEWRNNGDIRIGDEANNKWGFDWQKDITSDLSSDELDQLKSRAWHDLRDMRNVYLKRTDWWELPSQSPMSAERTAYRKALRDLPANTTDPFDVTWPTPPEYIDNP